MIAVLLLLFGTTVQADNSKVFEHYFRCFESLNSASLPRNNMNDSGSLVFLRGSCEGKSGIYAYSKEAVKFYAFPENFFNTHELDPDHASVARFQVEVPGALKNFVTAYANRWGEILFDADIRPAKKCVTDCKDQKTVPYKYLPDHAASSSSCGFMAEITFAVELATRIDKLSAVLSQNQTVSVYKMLHPGKGFADFQGELLAQAQACTSVDHELVRQSVEKERKELLRVKE